MQTKTTTKFCIFKTHQVCNISYYTQRKNILHTKKKGVFFLLGSVTINACVIVSNIKHMRHIDAGVKDGRINNYTLRINLHYLTTGLHS